MEFNYKDLPVTSLPHFQSKKCQTMKSYAKIISPISILLNLLFNFYDHERNLIENRRKHAISKVLVYSTRIKDRMDPRSECTDCAF